MYWLCGYIGSTLDPQPGLNVGAQIISSFLGWVISPRAIQRGTPQNTHPEVVAMVTLSLSKLIIKIL